MPVYVGAQVAASVCAAFALKVIFHPIMGGGVTVPSGSWSQAFALEFMISFNLMFVVTAVATDTRAVSSSLYSNFFSSRITKKFSTNNEYSNFQFEFEHEIRLLIARATKSILLLREHFLSFFPILPSFFINNTYMMRVK